MKLPAILNAITPKPPGGVERWAVKTGCNTEALTISPVPVLSTIAELIALPAPHDPIGRTPAESCIYAIPCTIVLWQLETDGDHHLVLRDEAGNTMIGEIPDPACVGPTSPWLAQITAAHAQFDEWPRLNKSCLVTGTLFMDRSHGQTGVAPNAVELHPILSIVDPEGTQNAAL